jgi:ribulose-phosphate 3-epimerase
MPKKQLRLHLGVKSDPIEYRYSYEWFFRILAEEDVHFVQLGSFFEAYQLPEEYFLRLREQAANFGIRIASTFTAHRELGGILRQEPGWEEVAHRMYRRWIDIGALVGADSVGSNPGAVLRDRMDLKQQGVEAHLRHAKEWMRYAHQKGVSVLAIEPMSCLAEPPTLPEEIRSMADGLIGFHNEHLHETCTFGYCVDVAHGYADCDGNTVYDNIELFEAALPYVTEIHLKNTDSRFDSTFGFSEAERERGIVDVKQIRQILLENIEIVPVSDLVGYLELGGPKTGRDYSDRLLENDLRQSIRYLREVFPSAAGEFREEAS